MSFEDAAIPRREFLALATTAFAVGSTILAKSTTAMAADPAAIAGVQKRNSGIKHPGLVRIASVPTAVEGGLLPKLIDSFKSETGLNVLLTEDDDPYNPAKEGTFDLVISHFGHRDAEAFILKGFGQWPRIVFSNQLGLFGPPSDPAGIRGMTDLVAAFSKIVAAKAPYVLNDTKGIKYLTEILWNAAVKPTKGSWFIDPGISKKDAIALAAKQKAYVIWGLTPFHSEQKASHSELVPLVTADQLLQRIMVSVVINPERVAGVNAADATRFQKYLLLPSTQAKMLTVHYPGTAQAAWAPAGRNNSGAALPQ